MAGSALNTFVSIINDSYEAIPKAGAALEIILRDDGLSTAAICAGITAVYYLITQWFIAEQPKQFIVNLFDLIVKLGLVMVLLTAGSSLARDIFVNATAEVAQKIAPSAKDPTAIVEIAFDTVVAITNGTERNATKPVACFLHESGDVLNPLSWIFNVTPEECKDRVNVGPFEILKYLPVILLTLAFQFIAVVATGLMAVAFIVVTLISKIIVEIGLIVGPLLIGLAVLPYLNFLFDGWLRYLITAALIPIVSWIMTIFMMNTIVPGLSAALKNLNKSAPDAETYFANNEMAMIAIAILSSIGAYLMWQVPQITSSLVSGGGIGVRAQGFGNGIISRTLKGGVNGAGGAMSKMTKPGKGGGGNSGRGKQ